MALVRSLLFAAIFYPATAAFVVAGLLASLVGRSATHAVVLGWVGGFFVQAVVRHYVTGAPLTAALLPMTGVAFVLFTFYMVTDPATTPLMPRAQFVFGASVALVYGLLVSLHVVFGFFFALATVSLVRGVTLYAQNYVKATADQRVAAQGALVVAREKA